MTDRYEVSAKLEGRWVVISHLNKKDEAFFRAAKYAKRAPVQVYDRYARNGAAMSWTVDANGNAAVVARKEIRR